MTGYGFLIFWLQLSSLVLPAAYYVAFASGGIEIAEGRTSRKELDPFPAVVQPRVREWHAEQRGILRTRSAVRQPRTGVLWTLPPKSRFERLGVSVHWRLLRQRRWCRFLTT